MSTPAPTNMTVHKTEEDWVHTNSTTGKFTIHPGIMNDIICLETGKHQEYGHLMKGPDKPKWTRAFENKIGRLFQRNMRYQGNKHMLLHTQAQVPPRHRGNIHPNIMQHKTPEDQMDRVQLTVVGDKLS